MFHIKRSQKCCLQLKIVSWEYKNSYKVAETNSKAIKTNSKAVNYPMTAGQLSAN